MAIDVYKEWLGIPEGSRPPDHYELLRLVRFEDDLDKVRAHYKKLNAHVRKYATGQYSTESQELLNELAKAMLCLTDPERKREYDESLGREFDDETDGQKSMADILVEQEHITRDQAREAESFADARGLSFRDAVVQMKLVDAETAAQALATELRRPFVDLAEMIPDDSVLDRVPRRLVKLHKVLPLFIDDDTLLVACTDEPEPELEDEFRLRFGLPMRGVLATPLAINQGIAKYYAAGMRDEAEGEAAAPVKSNGKSAKSKKQSRPKTSQLSSGEQAQRKQIGILIMCWATIGSVLVDQFVIRPLLVPTWTSIFLLSLFIPPAAIYWVLKSYWK